MMNSKQRLEAAAEIRKAHDYEHPSRFKSIDVSGSGILLLTHNHRAELLELHAEAEREIERLREYAEHKCKYDKKENWDTYDPPKFGCTCGLDELLNQESDDEGKD